MAKAYRSPSVTTLGKADVLTTGVRDGNTVEPRTGSTSVAMLDL
jgi:hypothetical protein